VPISNANKNRNNLTKEKKTMCDDFENDFDNNDDFMDEDEYDADMEVDDPLDGDSDLDGEPDDAESQGQEDDFTAKDAFIVGGAFGWGYEEGLRERKQRKRRRYSDDSD
jgi:hypothetical protein